MKARRLGVASALLALGLAQAALSWGATCDFTRNVRAGGGGTDTTIQAGVNNVTTPLTGNWCVYVDSATYGEMVTISGKVMNNYRIRIETHPGIAPPYRTRLNPPNSSASGFQVDNASVTLANMMIYPGTGRAVTDLINVTKNYVLITSMTLIDPLNQITAGNAIYFSGTADWGTISYSSVDILSDTGLRISQSSGTAISYSTFSVAGLSPDLAIDLWEASSNTFLSVVAENTLNNALNLNGTSVESSYNTFTRSSFTSTAASGAGNAIGPWAAWNVFDQCYFYSAMGQSLYYNANSNGYNTVRRSTFTSMDWSQGIWLDGDYNTIADSKIYSAKGTTLMIRPTATFTTISRSTVTNPTAAAVVVDIRGATTTITGSYIEGESPIQVRGATGTILNTSTIYGTDSALPAIKMFAYSQHLTLSSNTIRAGDAAAGVRFDYDDWRGNINIDSNTITVAAISAVTSDQNGISMDKPLNGAATVWITSNTFLPSLLTGRNLVILYMYGLAQGATIQGNDFYYRRAGASGYTTPFYVQNTTGVTFNHNRISNPGMVTGASNFYGADIRDSHNFTFTYNDIHSTSAITTDILLSLNYTTVTLKNNVFVSSSTAGTLWALKCVANAGKQNCGIDSDYNTFFSSSGGGNYSWADYGGTKQLAASWVTGKDVNSVFTHPQWFSTDINGEDFHPRSMRGRYRNGSWVTDGTTSPTIDRGDTLAPYALEPSPNGSRANQGSYGSTDEASQTYTPRRLKVIVIR